MAPGAPDAWNDGGTGIELEMVIAFCTDTGTGIEDMRILLLSNNAEEMSWHVMTRS